MLWKTRILLERYLLSLAKKTQNIWLNIELICNTSLSKRNNVYLAVRYLGINSYVVFWFWTDIFMCYPICAQARLFFSLEQAVQYCRIGAARGLL
jgi:hypothetical protein